MPEFTVIWEIDLDELDAIAAAVAAKEIQEDNESIATVFRVINKQTGEEVMVDVAAE